MVENSLFVLYQKLLGYNIPFYFLIHVAIINFIICFYLFSYDNELTKALKEAWTQIQWQVLVENVYVGQLAAYEDLLLRLIWMKSDTTFPQECRTFDP